MFPKLIDGSSKRLNNIVLIEEHAVLGISGITKTALLYIIFHQKHSPIKIKSVHLFIAIINFNTLVTFVYRFYIYYITFLSL